MAKITVGRTIEDDKDGVPYKFVTPDMAKLMSTELHRGDEIAIPVKMRDDIVTFWESGGRNEQFVSSMATVIATNNDRVIDAILFNKISRSPNGRQALVGLKPGYFLYVGKISIRRNVLAPKMKIAKLRFIGIDAEMTTEDTVWGTFILDELFTTYESLRGCIPGARLIDKLFTKDVIKPYFVNGWSTSNVSGIRDKDTLREECIRLMSIPTVSEHIQVPNKFIDALENNIVANSDTKLSAVFQWIDFGAGIVGFKPMKGLELSNISKTINAATVERSFTIEIASLMKGYNPHMLFESIDPDMLEMAMGHDSKFGIEISDRVFGILRGFRG